MYSNDNQGRVYKNCKFLNPDQQGRYSCVRAWAYRKQSENALSLVCSICNVRRPVIVKCKILNCITPGTGVLMLGVACDHVSHIVKMHFFFENLFFSPRHKSDKLSIYGSNDNKGLVYPNCKF